MTGRPTLFPMGGAAFSWLKDGGAMSHVDWRTRLQIKWQSFWFDRNISLQRKIGPAAWRGDNPVFVMGLWRSGTTYMHELLGSYPGFICPVTWQCMNPSTFAMQSLPRESVSIARPMDDFSINTFSPQEDEFALLALGVPSVYRAFFDPAMLDDVSKWLDPGFWCVNPDGWIEKWREFLGGVSAGREGRMLLKSPNHTFRIRALVEAFPKASYIWLVRDPSETFFSNRKMWRSMFKHYALRSWDESALDGFLGKAFQYAGESLEYAMAVLERDQLVVVDFDRFTHAPLKNIATISKRLNFGEWETINESIIASVAGVTVHSADSYNDDRLNQLQVNIAEHLTSVQKRAIDSHGL